MHEACWHPRTSTPGLGAPLPHLPQDWAHPFHICPGTGRTKLSALRPAALESSVLTGTLHNLRAIWVRPGALEMMLTPGQWCRPDSNEPTNKGAETCGGKAARPHGDHAAAGLSPLLPHLRHDLACPPTSAPGPAFPLPHLHQDHALRTVRPSPLPPRMVTTACIRGLQAHACASVRGRVRVRVQFVEFLCRLAHEQCSATADADLAAQLAVFFENVRCRRTIHSCRYFSAPGLVGVANNNNGAKHAVRVLGPGA